MNFSANFKRLCRERGTTRTELLKSIGVSSSKVTLWANGSIPKPQMLQKLAEALNCEVSEFFTEDAPVSPNTSATPSSIYLSEDESEIVRIYRSLSRRQQHEFMVRCYDLDASNQQEGSC